MDEKRKKLLQKFLLSKGLIWGGKYNLIDNLTGINCYEVSMNDTKRDGMMDGSICENDLMLTIWENGTNDYDMTPENYMVYDFSAEWTKYLLTNLPNERETIEQEVKDLIEKISEKMVTDIADLQFEYESNLERIQKKANDEIAIYEELLNVSKEQKDDLISL